MKKRNTNDFISMWYRINSVPRGGITKVKFYRIMIRFTESGSGVLPKGLGITWFWRNKKDGKEHQDDFQTVVSESRASFLTLMTRRLRRDLEAVAPGEKAPKYKVRFSTAREEAMLKELEEEQEEARAESENRRKTRKRKFAKKSKYVSRKRLRP